jgi:hypothetical protein
MKKFISACLSAWSAVALLSAGIVTNPKKVNPVVQKEQCCDKREADPDCCPSSCCS